MVFWLVAFMSHYNWFVLPRFSTLFASSWLVVKVSLFVDFFYKI